MEPEFFGGIEGGGTKFICAIADAQGQVLNEVRFPTTTPGETLARAIAYFQSQAEGGTPISALGVACFGPLDPHPDSPTYGHLLSTPKAGWAGVDIAGRLQEALQVPLGFDTDVNGAALGEHQHGAARNLHTFVYYTIGTGIGGGAMVHGQLLHGMLHPEMGHVPLPHDPATDPFPGLCPFHGDCFEGLACGPAMQARWGQPPEDLPPEHPAWQLEAHYIALALQGVIVTLSPQRIILGGGVCHQPVLLPLVRQETLALLNGYIQSSAILAGMDSYIMPPALGSRSGIIGAISLAQAALHPA